jgi:trehalose utilization protein
MGLIIPFMESAWGEVINVVVWDEQQPKQKQAYENFLGNHIAEHLRKSDDFNVTSVRLDDPDQGLSDAILDNCDVLVWWGHRRNGDVSPEVGKAIVDRIVAGELSFAALHSAHWSTPFVEAMNWRTRQDATKLFPSSSGEKVEFTFTPPAERFTTPEKDSHLTPSYYPRKFPGGVTKVAVNLPTCCFPGYRNVGEPSHINVVKPEHPLAKGVPATFTLPTTEMYNEPFHVPAPDDIIMEERWPTGEWFRTAMTWNIGKGKVVYFRPGHENFDVFHQEEPLTIVENAARWLGKGTRTAKAADPAARRISPSDAGGGSVTGTVSFVGTPPPLRPVAMTSEPTCHAVHKDNPIMNEMLVLGEGQTMGNIIVKVIEGLPNKKWPLPEEPFVVTQKGCVYAPHVFVVRANQSVKILNPDGVLHNVNASPKENRPFNRAMPPNVTELPVSFGIPEDPFSLRCNAHPWMSAYCEVIDHPFYNVTLKDGVYTIKGLDPGEYTIQAWHERLGKQTATVTVTADGTATQDFSFSVPPRKK